MIEGFSLAAWMFPVLFGAQPAAVAVPPGHDELVIDLSRHEVSVALNYAGAELVLFGATAEAGDVVVEVRGPRRTEVVRRKERVGGIWLNSEEVVFGNVPAFYALASSAPLDQILPLKELVQERIGVDHLWLTPTEKIAEQEADAFRAALVRNKQRVNLFPAEPTEVKFLGNRLFRTDIHFPANASVGPYRVTVFLVKGGEVVRSASTPLILSRTGFEARVFDLAHTNGLAYGLLAIAIAVVAGWLASVFFRSKA
jgi:uncharacterized protein (TIGR02186 family)